MKRIKLSFFLGMLTLVFVLFACAAEETPPPTEVAPTSPSVDTDTPEPTATLTAVPPTATPTEATPTYTATAGEKVDPLADYPEEGYGPMEFPEDINPLTGLPVEDPTILDRRPGQFPQPWI